tara:strand:+ start:1232 stop:1675 length:444 start_codon:yes stop_codon:yes gene_type:complete
MKWQQMFVPTAAQTGAVTMSAAIDATGCTNMTILVCAGAIADSGTWTVMKLQSSSTSGGTYTDVTGGDITDAVIGTATMPETNDDGKIWQWQVPVSNLSNKFYKMAITCGSNASALAVIVGLEGDNAEGNNSSTTNTGCEAVVRPTV